MTPDPTILDEAPPADGDAPTAGPATPASSSRAANIAFDGQGSTRHDDPPTDNGSLLLLAGFVGVILAIGFLRSWWFPGILAGLLFMLFMHELGHFLTARASGMKVTEFFLGFGPKIWSFNRGETEYGVKAIPAGAYVRIMGMTNLDDIDPAEEHRTYRAQPYWQRMMTICAGSAMHFLMATVALLVLFAAYAYPGFNGPPWSVSEVVPGSTAASLGVEAGDRIVSINGNGFANWDEFGDLVADLEEGPVSVVIERDGEELRLDGELGLRPEDIMLDGFGLNLAQEVPGVGYEAAFVWPEDPADEFGIEQGDVIRRVDELDSPTETEMALLLQDREGQEIRIEVLRDGDTIVLEDRVELRTSTPFRGFFGVGRAFDDPADKAILDATGAAVRDFGTIARVNLVGIIDLVNPANWGGDGEQGFENRAAELRERQIAQQQAIEAASGSECGGPDTNRPLSVVGIGRLISCSESADQVLFLFAVVNIFIGIFNLVPLLPLDGGHALIATYERARELVTGKHHRVDAAKLVPVTWLVIFLLVGVGVWTTTLDIFSW